MNQYPAKPEDTSEAGWLRWVNANFPFARDWEEHLLKRKPTERPREGSRESLDDLRGIEDRRMAAFLAAQWWHIFEHGEEIAESKRVDREREWQKERARLVQLAKKALEGNLGESREDRNDAQATAQAYLHQVPEHCSDDDLRDWEKMHRYARRVAKGEQVKRPRLAADVRREAEQRRSIDDMHYSIGAAQAGRPSTRYQQENLGGGW